MADTAVLLPIAAWFLFRFIDFESDSEDEDSDSDFDGSNFPLPQQEHEQFRNHHHTSIMPKNQGYSNYSSTEVKSFLDVLEDKLPIGPDQWQEVADLHEQNGFKHRDAYSLRRKFNTLHKKTCPTGDPDMPNDVRQAKSIKYMIGEKANLIDASPQFDLQNGGYGATITPAGTTDGDKEPMQQQEHLLLGQPTQLTQTQEQTQDAGDGGTTTTTACRNTPPPMVNTAPPVVNTAPPMVNTLNIPTTSASCTPSPAAPPPLKRKWNRHSSSSTNSEFLETYQASLLEAREERRAAREERDEERRAAREERIADRKEANADRKEARDFFMQAMQAWMMNNPRKKQRKRHNEEEDEEDDK